MPEAYPAITIWQPWAELIMVGLKPFEFRTWPAPRYVHERRIAIHAGAHKPTRGEIVDLLYSLRSPTLQGSLGLRLSAKQRAEAERIVEAALTLPRGAILGTVLMDASLRCTDLFPSQNADPGMWGWPVSQPVRLPVPLPAQGSQGWWTWSCPND